MTDNEIDAFVEALLSDRAPKQFPVSAEDRDLLELAIAMRAERSEIVSPDPAFVDQLHRQLAAAAKEEAPVPNLTSPRSPTRRRDLAATARSGIRPAGAARYSRRFQTLVQAAAAAFLVAGTFTATHLADDRSPVPAQAHAGSVRSGVLLSASGRSLGRAYAYDGSPSWVFMDVQASDLSGVYICHLHLSDGTTIPAGVVTVYHGAGDWAHTTKVPADDVRSATLDTPNGAVMARVNFT